MSDAPPATARFNPRVIIALVVLVVGAYALRWWNIGFGLPELFHPDEGRKVMIISSIGQDQLPGNYSHPSLMVNAVAMVAKVTGKASPGVRFSKKLFEGRLVCAVVGALTVIPVFFLASQLYGVGAGFFAGAAIAIAPLHVVNSRYLKEEVWLAFFVVLSACFFIRWLQTRAGSRCNHWFMLSAIAAGAAMASKYIGVLALLQVCVLAVIVAGDWGARARLVVIGLLLGGITFCVLSPQMFLEWAAFSRDFGYEAHHGAAGGGRETLYFWQKPDFGFYFFYAGIGWGLGWPVVVAALATAVVSLRMRRFSREAVLLIAIILMWYVVAELSPAKRGVGRERYILSCLPLLAVLAGGLLHHLQRMQYARWIPLIAALLLAEPLIHSIAITRAITPDTRVLAREFFKDLIAGREIPVVHFGGYPAIRVPSVRIKDRTPALGQWENIREALKESQFVTSSSFALDRYDKFPDLDRELMKQIREMRRMYPYVARFSKSPYVSKAFHNPVIEIRAKLPLDGFVYEGRERAAPAVVTPSGGS